MSFPKARLCLLRENGEAVSLTGARVDLQAAQRIVLSRALARFQVFAPPQGLSRGRADKAALLFAETHAPFTATDSLLLRRAEDYAIWQWDREQVAALAGPRRYRADRIAVETLLQPRGEGFRHIECADGFEAQYWSGGVLRASQWKRRPFDADSWSGFALGIDAAARTSAEPPKPVVVALSDQGEWRRARVRPPIGWREIEQGGWTAALCAAAVAAVFAGQAIRYEQDRGEALRAVEAQTQAERTDNRAARARAAINLIRAYQEGAPEPSALAVAAGALSVLNQAGYDVVAWRADGSLFTATVSPSPSGSLETVAFALEREPALANVTPQTGDNGEIVFTADIVRGGVS